MNTAEFFIGNRKVSGKVFLVCLLSVVSLSAVGHELLIRLEDHLAETISRLATNP